MRSGFLVTLKANVSILFSIQTFFLSYFAIELKKRVLIVDCDPQCNITQYILGDDRTIDLYWPKDNKDTRCQTEQSTERETELD